MKPTSPRSNARRRPARRYNQATLAMPLPPIPLPEPIPAGGQSRLMEDERYWMTDKTLHLLAYRYVQVHGWKYRIDRDEQVAILFLKMCSMVAAGLYDYERGAFSTLCWSMAFPRTLQRAAIRKAKTLPLSDRRAERIEDRSERHDVVINAELAAVVRRLPKSHREIVRMAYGVGYPELTIQEIAILHRRTTVWVRKKIDEGLTMLRAAYSVEPDADGDE